MESTEEEVTSSFLNDPSKLLLYCSIPLFVRGAHLLDNPNKYFYCLHVVYLLLVVCYHCYPTTYEGSYSMSQNLDDLVGRKLSKKIQAALFYQNWMGFCVFLPTTIFFVVRRKRIIQFVKKVQLQSKEQGFNKSALLAAILVTTYIVFQGTLDVLVFLGEFDSSTKPWLLVQHCFRRLTSDPVVSPLVIYFIFLRMTYHRVRNDLDSIRDGISSNGMSFSDAKNIHTRLTSTLNHLEKFDEIFSFLPFLWLTFNFTHAVVITIFYILAEFKTANYYLFFGINNLAVIALVIYMTHSQCRRLSVILVNDIQHRIVTDNTGQASYPLLANSIVSLTQSISSFHMTAYSFFTLEKSIILSFLSNVTTFTVMFSSILGIDVRIQSDEKNGTALTSLMMYGYNFFWYRR